MATEAILALVNLAVWTFGLFWLTRLRRTAKRQDAAALGAVGHYRPALTLVGLVLLIAGWWLVVHRHNAPFATSALLGAALAGQVLALALVDRWHRFEEKHARSRLELYSDLQGCYLMLGVAGLTALSVVPALLVVVRLLFVEA